jgi:hypothetical protein
MAAAPPPPHDLGGIVFDLDDTLFDSSGVLQV